MLEARYAWDEMAYSRVSILIALDLVLEEKEFTKTGFFLQSFNPNCSGFGVGGEQGHRRDQQTARFQS